MRYSTPLMEIQNLYTLGNLCAVSYWGKTTLMFFLRVLKAPFYTCVADLLSANICLDRGKIKLSVFSLTTEIRKGLLAVSRGWVNYRSSNTAAHQEDTVVSGVSNAKLPFLRLSPQWKYPMGIQFVLNPCIASMVSRQHLSAVLTVLGVG